MILTAILAIGTLFVQGYIYSEPQGGLLWRGPVGGLVLATFLCFWCVLDYRAIDSQHADIPYNTLDKFSADRKYPEKPYPKMTAVRDDNQELRYEWIPKQGQPDYYLTGDDPHPWEPVDNNNRVTKSLTFLDRKDKPVITLKIEKQQNFQRNKIRYLDEKTRQAWTAEDVSSGQVSVTSWGAFPGQHSAESLLAGTLVFLPLAFAAVPIGACMGLAIALWVVLVLVVLPLLLERTQAEAMKKPAVADRHHIPGTGVHSA